MLLDRYLHNPTLFVVIGVKHVECAIFMGGKWLKDSLFQVPVDSSQDMATSFSALSASISQIESFVHEWQSTQSGKKSHVINSIRVLVADPWLSVGSVPWNNAIKRKNMSEAFTRNQLAASGFEVGSSDIVRLDDAPFGHPRLAVAYPSTILALLMNLADSVKGNVVSVLPLGAAAWSAVEKQRRDQANALAVYKEGLLLVLYGQGRLTDVTARIGTQPGANDYSAVKILGELWRRMQLRDLQLAQINRLPFLNLTSSNEPAQEQKLISVELPLQTGKVSVSPLLHLAALSRSRRLAIDAIPSGYLMTPVRWVALGIALFLTGFIAAQAWQKVNHAQMLANKMQVEQVEESPTRLAPDWSREEIARIQAVNATVRQLNLPISALLHALQPPRDIRVAVLSIEMTGAASTNTDQPSGVKIIAEAHTGVDMARYVSFLSERRPFSMAYLTNHEIVESAPEHPYRFTVETAWSE